MLRDVIAEVDLDVLIVGDHTEQRAHVELVPTRQLDTFDVVEFIRLLLAGKQLLDKLPINGSVDVEVTLLLFHG